MKARRSRKTATRIRHIETEINGYKKSIARLYDCAIGVKLKGLQYQRTQEDETRMQWTLKNIRTQMEILQHELMALQEYGV